MSLFHKIEQSIDLYPGETFRERYEALKTEYNYMSDFMLQGYNDSRRHELYDRLCRKVQDLEYDLEIRKGIYEMPYLKATLKYLLAGDTSTEELQSQLLTTTSDPRRHYEVLTTAFHALLASYHWKEQDAEEWTAFLMSPHTPVEDAATLITAITLNLYTLFSLQKSLCLANIYTNSSNEVLRQRAFVGCIISLRGWQPQVLDVLSLSSTFQKDLQEVELQMLSCANARKDSEEIRHNIMPDIIKNQPFQITKNGIVEREEENDIIDIHADDRRMDRMEESIRKMVGMQKKGADIFFEGFSQMKRYPFYNKLMNWFVPFTIDHPDIQKEMEPLRHSGFVDRVMKKGPFCDSDKYSFIIAISSFINQLPEKIREMMENGEMGPLGMQNDENVTTDPSFVRLRYLQDMYRFFTLHTLGKTMENPFLEAQKFSSWLYAAPSLSDDVIKEMCTYLLSKRNHSDKESRQYLLAALHEIDSHFKDHNSFDYHFIMAEESRLQKDYPSAIKGYQACLKIKQNDPASLRGIAHSYFADKDYSHAAFYFDALHTLFPKRNSYAINYAVAMVRDGMAAEVLNDMYKMDFEQPDNDQIQSTLAWALLFARKPEQALSLCEKIQARQKPADVPSLLNIAYAYIFSGKMPQAIQMLDDYASSLSKEQRDTLPIQLRDAMCEDIDLLKLYDFGEAEIEILSSRYEA